MNLFTLKGPVKSQGTDKIPLLVKLGKDGGKTRLMDEYWISRRNNFLPTLYHSEHATLLSLSSDRQIAVTAALATGMQDRRSGLARMSRSKVEDRSVD